MWRAQCCLQQAGPAGGAGAELEDDWGQTPGSLLLNPWETVADRSAERTSQRLFCVFEGKVLSVVFLSRELTLFAISFAKTHLLLESLDVCHWLCNKVWNEAVLEKEGL